MTKRFMSWIQIIEPDGTNKIAAPSYIAELIGLKALENKVRNMKQQIHNLKAPERKTFILDALKKTPHSINWFERHTPDYDYYDLRNIAKEGLIEFFHSGTQRMYRLVENEK